MPCDNPKCSITLNNKNISNYSDLENIFCEFHRCKKKFCNNKCLQKHFIEEHNFDNKKNFFNYNDLNLAQKKLLKKTIEQNICGVYIEETLTEHKKRISNDLNELINTQNLQIKFEQIENDYNNLEYFYYFHIKNFDNPHSSSSFSSNLNKTANFANTTDISNNSNNDNNNNNNNIINTSKNKNIIPKQFTKIIGSGAFGDVFLVKNSLDGKLFAIKQLNREKIKENGIDTEIVFREINTHFKLVHNNIARLYDYFEDKKAFYLILEYVENGTLFNKIQKSNGLPEERALKYFVQVSSAVFFLHENQLIHRDIKPENCLIDKNDNVKLCDFGWTVEISKGERITFCGTYEYMAPEIIKEVPYNHMIDIWSLGVLLYELIHSFSPFRAKQNKNNPLKYDPNNIIMNNIIKNKFEFEKDISKECKDLIAKILNPDKNSRLNLKDIFTHPYLMDYFINRFYLKITKMFDIFEISLTSKKFIFIKFYSSGKKRNKSENNSLFEDMEISINNKSLRTKNSTNDINTFLNSNNSKVDISSSEKSFERKILNLKMNNFFFKMKTEFFKKLKSLSKPIRDKNILLNNLNTIIKENNSLILKNKIIVNEDLNDISEENTICKKENINSNILNLSNNSNNTNKSYKDKDYKLNKIDEIKCDNILKNNSCEAKAPLKSIIKNKNSEFLEEVLDKIQNKRARFGSVDMDNCDFSIKKDLNNSKNNCNHIKKKKSSKRTIKNLIETTEQIINNIVGKDNLNSSKNLILTELNKSKDKISKQVFNNLNNNDFNNLLISNNNSLKIISDNYINNNNSIENVNRCSSIKEIVNISNTEYSLMKEIKDINTVIEHKNKKVENFIENKNMIKKVLEENIINSNSNNNNINGNRYNNMTSSPNHIEQNKKSLHNRKASEGKEINFTTNDINLNFSKISDLKVCKNVNLSLLENSMLSAIKKDSPDITNHFSNKNILNNFNNNNNNNEIIIISSINNQNGKNCLNNNFNINNESLNNFAYSDRSIFLKNSQKENESQNFWFTINNSIERIDNKSPKEKNINNSEQFSVLSNINDTNNKNNSKENKNIKDSKLNTSQNNNKSLANTSINNNDSLLATEKVKEFSLISNKESPKKINHNKHKSINTSKNSYDSNYNNNYDNSNRKYSKNNNYLIANEKNFKNNNSKISKQFTNSSIGNTSWEFKNNIMKIRKNNRKSINKKNKDSHKGIKIKDFEEIIVENNNKSFEEKTENCSMWKNFFGFFNVFKCGRGNAN